MAKKAVRTETGAKTERVEASEATATTKRSEVAETIGTPERVDIQETTARTERSSDAEQSEMTERVDSDESSEVPERSSIREPSGTLERAVEPETKVREKRAVDKETKDNEERPFSLSRQEVKAASKFTRDEALALIGMYYALQKVRIAQGNRISAHERGSDTMAKEKPAPQDELPIVRRLKGETLRIELQCQRALREFANASVIGRWAMSQYGVGPVIAAGLLAHIDWNRCHWAGQLYSFAGLNPNQEWKKGQKRPYNANLKKLLWNLGECFKRVSGKKEAFYGQIYAQRKKLEIAKNESGVLEAQAKAMLEEAEANKWRISKEMKETWASGKLQACGLDLRATRYSVKLFLSHLHQIAREVLFNEKVLPWILVHGGHGDYIAPPNWPME